MKKYDVPMMQTAFIWAKQSSCKRNQVGAIIANQGRIISNGYNGTITGADNCCEDGDVSKNTVVHAEANALMFAAKNGIPTEGCSIYVTLSPCIECAKMIIQAGIKEVMYHENYRIDQGIEFLKEHNIKVRKV